jgi:hypothetical protein
MSSLRLKELMAQMEIGEKVAERSEFEAKEWQKILLRFPQIRDIEANFRICQEFCHPMDVSCDSIVLLVENDESFVSALSLAEPEIIKRELLDKISALHGELTDATDVVRHRRKLMAFWSLENLRKELARIESVTAMQGKSTTELRQIVRQGRSAPGPPELPRKILIHGEMVKLNAARIKGLDSDSLRTLIRKYSADAVSARLRGE